MNPAPPFDVIELDEALVQDVTEPLGTKAKFWYVGRDHQRWLFKYARPHTGEHWSERIASEVARVLGIPCADVELARYRDHWGTVSRDFTSGGKHALVHGNELLSELSADYPIDQRFRVKEHTLAAIFEVLGNAEVGVPEGVGVALPEPKAFALFTGYLMLDALVGNTDRHHENWGVLLRSEIPRSTALAPT